jgi:hypothetical protein
MTEDEIYSVSLVRFTAILGLRDHTHYPQEATWWSCDGTQSDALHVWERWVQTVQSWRFQTIFLCSIGFCRRLCLQGRVIHLGSVSMKETSYMPSVKKKGSMCSTSFFRKFGMWLSPTTGHVPMHPITLRWLRRLARKHLWRTLSTPNFIPTNSSLPSNLELGHGFHLLMLPATTGVQLWAS